MRDLWLNTVRTRGLRPAPVALGLALIGLGVAVTVPDGRLGPQPLLACVYALVVSSGLIGCDVQDGAVQLLLARPLSRSRYLAGRLLGAATLILAFSAVMMATVAPFVRSGSEQLSTVTAALTSPLWVLALLFLFSTVLPGRADALAALCLFLASGLLHSIRLYVESDWAAGAIGWLWDNVTSVVVIQGASLSPAEVTDVLRWSSNVALALLAGVLAFNHRQFGYAD